jgi:endonuclease/exonuclease/phosphatase family metal-dependent hydrolase
MSSTIGFCSHLARFALVISSISLGSTGHAQTTGAPVATSVATPVSAGVAAFNMAWAGTPDDFKRHREVCAAPSVNWCETRAWIVRGAAAATPEEQARATQCQQATLAAVGGQDASMSVPPCNAYRNSRPLAPGEARPDPNLERTAAAYQEKLDGLRATVESVIERDAVRVIAFQEVRSAAVIKLVLGKYAEKFDVCEAKHNAFQSLAFAWDKTLTSKPGVCRTESALAILDPPNDPTAFRRVRPGLELELVINGAPVAFMNIHLKAGCASVNNSNERFPGRLLTDAAEACEVLNRQVPILENWVEAVSAKNPRLVLLGDFNRRIDDEVAMAPAKNQIRTDGSDPASPNKAGADGKVATKYLWQELSDGTPTLHQIPLSTSEGGCSGFQGLDHIVISDALKALNPGTIASRKVGVVSVPNQKIETSDHCPRVAQLRF